MYVHHNRTFKFGAMQCYPIRVRLLSKLVPRVRSRQGYVQYVMPLSCKMDGNNISVLKQYIKRSIYVIDQVHGQDGWILAKFSFCVFTGRDEVEVHKNAKMSHEMNHRKCSN